MKTILIGVLVISAHFGFCQPRFEIQEFTGTIVAIEPGWSFALQVIRLKVDDQVWNFSVPLHYGREILLPLKVGQTLSLKANVNLAARKRMEKLTGDAKEFIDGFIREAVTEIKIKNEWIQLLPGKDEILEDRMRVMLEKKIEDEYWLNGYRAAVVYEKNKVAYYSQNSKRYYPLKDVKKGDVVSFIGGSTKAREGFAYPIDGITTSCFYRPLTKVNGIITGFLFKQNFACIGLVLNFGKGEIKFAFPSDMANRFRSYSGQDQNVTVYYDDFKIENQLEPRPIHALVYNSDTIRIESLFSGGADVNHKYNPTEINGKITKITSSEKGKIIAILVGNDCLIEVDQSMGDQLISTLTKGREITITGEERIKKEGEFYSKNYRIITPKKVGIGGKVYLIN